MLHENVSNILRRINSYTYYFGRKLNFKNMYKFMSIKISISLIELFVSFRDKVVKKKKELYILLSWIWYGDLLLTVDIFFLINCQ